jgi:hypothetical protein
MRFQICESYLGVQNILNIKEMGFKPILRMFSHVGVWSLEIGMIWGSHVRFYSALSAGLRDSDQWRSTLVPKMPREWTIRKRRLADTRGKSQHNALNLFELDGAGIELSNKLRLVNKRDRNNIIQN